MDPISVQGEPPQVLLRSMLLTMNRDDVERLVSRLDSVELRAVRRAAEMLMDATSAAIIGRGDR